MGIYYYTNSVILKRAFVLYNSIIIYLLYQLYHTQGNLAPIYVFSYQKGLSSFISFQILKGTYLNSYIISAILKWTYFLY